jgi:exodeoxyribonuclease VIII
VSDGYDALPGVRWSRLKAMRISPLAYRHGMLVEREDTPSLRFGRAVHCRVLEPDAWASRYAVWDGHRRGKAWEQWEAEHAGFEILTAAEHERARACADAVIAHPVARRHLHDGIRERALSWTDEETGLPCKARVDSVNGHLLELKTAADIDPRRFAAAAYRYGYHGQLAFYGDGLIASGFALESDPALVCVESVPPHDVIVYAIDSGLLELGREYYRSCLRRLAECLASDEWPGLAPTGEMALILPDWAHTENEDEAGGDLGLIAAAE